MLQLSKIFWGICRLKSSPQDLPKGLILLIAAALAGIIVDSFSSSLLMPKLANLEIVKIIVIYNILLLAAIYFLLKLLGYTERGIQTLTAMAGSGLFISLVLLPTLLMLDAAAKSFIFLILIDSIWRVVVNAHIFRHALSIGLLMAMILSVSYFLFSVMLAEFLLPAQAT